MQNVSLVAFWHRLLLHGGPPPQTEGLVLSTGLLELHVVTDLVVALAFLAICTSLLVLVRRARFDAPFKRMVLAFAVLVGAAGLAHLAEIWTGPGNRAWVLTALELATAATAVATAIALPLFLPAALKLIRAARVSEHRRKRLEVAHRDLQALFTRLKESERARSDQFTNVSHELRTPLSLILGPATSLLDDGALSRQQRLALETVVRNALLLEKHVNDLLLVAKGETGEAELIPEYAAVDLARLVRRTAGNFDGIAMQRDIELMVETPKQLPAEIDADAIERVIINLLSNAFKFTPAGGRIRLLVEKRDDDAVLSVGDSGPGVPAEVREVIFERFRQADGGSTRKFGGFGLGLAIVRSFVEMHGGSVAVGRSDEGGALFTVTLPRTAPPGQRVAPSRPSSVTEPAVATADLIEAGPPRAPHEAQERERGSVLVVEDNPEMNRFMTSTLGADYRTRFALDGATALELARQEAPDLIITDVMMPVMSGIELLNKVRSMDELAQTPILVVTARDDAELRTQLLRNGAQDFLTKPFTAAELSARAHNLVTAKRARDHLSREVHNQRMDLEALAKTVATHKRELEAALEETRIARSLAEQGSRMKSNLFRMMSHELRTPLTAAQLQLTLFERGGNGLLSETQRESIDRIHRSLRRLLDLIESALEYARIESGRFEVRPSRFSLADMVTGVVEEFRPYAERKNVDLTVQVEGEIPLIRSDREVARLVTVNLISNAVKLTNEGSVQVRVFHDERGHGLIVKDSGPGVPESHRELVFEPFEQTEDVRFREGPGSGLGLALVKEMVTALGGRIHVESNGERGAAFVIRVPSVHTCESDAGHMRRETR